MSVLSVTQPQTSSRPRLITVVERRYGFPMSVTDFCEQHGSEQAGRLGLPLDPASHSQELTIHQPESNGWRTSIIARPALLSDEWRCAVCFPGQMVDV